MTEKIRAYIKIYNYSDFMTFESKSEDEVRETLKNMVENGNVPIDEQDGGYEIYTERIKNDN